MGRQKAAVNELFPIYYKKKKKNIVTNPKKFRPVTNQSTLYDKIDKKTIGNLSDLW